MRPTPTIKLYTKSYCGWCREVKDYLNKLGWKFEELEVSQNPKNYKELIDISGQERTPTGFFDGKLLADFGAKELEVFLRKENYLSSQ